MIIINIFIIFIFLNNFNNVLSNCNTLGDDISIVSSQTSFKNGILSCIQKCDDETCGIACGIDDINLSTDCSQCVGDLIQCRQVACESSCPNNIIFLYDTNNKLTDDSKRCASCLESSCLNSFIQCSEINDSFSLLDDCTNLCWLLAQEWFIPVAIGFGGLLFLCLLIIIIRRYRKYLKEEKEIQVIAARERKAKRLSTKNINRNSNLLGGRGNSSNLSSEASRVSQYSAYNSRNSRKLIKNAKTAATKSAQQQKIDDLINNLSDSDSDDDNEHKNPDNEADNNDSDNESVGGVQIVVEKNVRASKLPADFGKKLKLGLTPELLYNMEQLQIMQEANAKAAKAKQENLSPKSNKDVYVPPYISGKREGRAGYDKKMSKGVPKALKMMGIDNNDIQKPYHETVEERMQRLAKAAAKGGGYNVGGATANFASAAAIAFNKKRTKQLVKNEQKRILNEVKKY